MIAIYGGAEAQVRISPIAILEGKLPRRATSMVLEWGELHNAELMHNWNLMQDANLPQRIEPLD